MKIKTIKLKYFDVYIPMEGKEAWKVMHVTDSIEFNPGQALTKAQVDELCNAKDWKVSIALD